MNYCIPCATALSVANKGKADVIRTGGYSVFGECQRCGRKNRPVIEYEIKPKTTEAQNG